MVEVLGEVHTVAVAMPWWCSGGVVEERGRRGGARGVYQQENLGHLESIRVARACQHLCLSSFLFPSLLLVSLLHLCVFISFPGSSWLHALGVGGWQCVCVCM